MEELETPELKKPFMQRLRSKPAFVAIVSSVLSIIVGMLIGLVVLLCIKPAYAFSSYANFLVYGFSNKANIAQFIYKAAPYLMTGLAVAFCFKAGSFNIGGPGQYFIGGVCAYLACVKLQAPWYLSLLCAILGGAFMGFLPGILKAAFNVNEVLSAIMLNWLSLILGNWLLHSLNLYTDSHTMAAGNLNTNSDALLPSWGLESFSTYFTIAIFIGMAVAVICWVILSKTTFGFKIKACGLNKDAAKYAGIKSKKTLVMAFIISGALAGLGGAFYILLPNGSNTGFTDTYTDLSAVAGIGFDGISVALLASNNPIGCIFSAIFISYIKLSSSGLSPRFNKNVGDVVIGVIVYFASFIALVRMLVAKGFIKLPKRDKKEAVVASASSEPVAKLSPVINKAEEKKPQMAAVEVKPIEKKEETKTNSSSIKEEEKDVATPEEMKALIGSLVNTPLRKEGDNTEINRQKEKEQVVVTHAFVIEKSPYHRDELDDYNPDSALNADDAELQRQAPKKKEGK